MGQMQTFDDEKEFQLNCPGSAAISEQLNELHDGRGWKFKRTIVVADGSQVVAEFVETVLEGARPRILSLSAIQRGAGWIAGTSKMD